MNENTSHTEELAHTNRITSRSESDEFSDCSSEQDSRLPGSVEHSGGTNSEQNLENDANLQVTEKKGDGESEKKVTYVFLLHVHINFKGGMSFLVMEICVLVLFELDINLAYHIKVCLTRDRFVVNISRSQGKVHFPAAYMHKSRVAVIIQDTSLYIVSPRYSYSHAIVYMLYR